jgi:hypothetical protein
MILRNISQNSFANLNKKGFSAFSLKRNKYAIDGIELNHLNKTFVRFQTNDQTTNATDTINQEIKQGTPKSTSLPSSIFRCSVSDPVSNSASIMFDY